MPTSECNLQAGEARRVSASAASQTLRHVARSHLLSISSWESSPAPGDGRGASWTTVKGSSLWRNTNEAATHERAPANAQHGTPDGSNGTRDGNDGNTQHDAGRRR